ncbi:MAG: malto-oligosyltrehalose trehalohydrolase [Candidatus Dormibacteraeota bacterium]|nr:malto-oligosyltrehalose trehalohydrolase [Candidatus Dormibacteraeota bacterium]
MDPGQGFEVWAPVAERVELWLRGESHSMRRREGGWWSARRRAEPGERYGFRLDGSEPLPDPRSRSQPDGVDGLSAVVDLAFPWTDRDWRPPQVAGLRLYELHVGTFTAAGTFDAVIERLQHLVELGVNALELMPVAEFAGERGWGYDGVDFWAPHHVYGGSAGLRRLVDACHARGLAVVLDVVYNHVGPEGNHARRFGPYVTDRHQTTWGETLNFDGPDSGPVRDFVLGNAEMWLRDYHIDGLRLDAVHAIHDSSPRHVLTELADRVHRLGGFVIAEKPRIDRTLLALGVDAQWDDELHHALHVLLTGERQGYYRPYPGTIADIARALLEPAALGVDPRRIVAPAQTHDQVGNRALGERLAQLVDPRRLRIAAALTLLSPFIPMLFMGEEWGAATPFLFFSDRGDPEAAAARTREFAGFGWSADQVPDPEAPSTFLRSKLDWSEPEREPHRSLLAFHRALLRRRLELAAAPLEVDVAETEGLLVMRRGNLAVRADLRRGEVAIGEESSRER